MTREQLDAIAISKVVPPKPVSPTATRKGKRGADAITRTKAYLTKMPGAVSGQNGSGATYEAACVCNRFGLSEEQAVQVLLLPEYNGKCTPPWSEEQLRHKVADAYRKHPEEHGQKLEEDRSQSRTASTEGETETETETFPDSELCNPSRLARLFFRQDCHPDRSRLAFYHGQFLRWDHNRYADYPDVRHHLVSCIEQEFDRFHEFKMKAWGQAQARHKADPTQKPGRMPAKERVTTRLVRDVIQALEATALVASAIDAPDWLRGPHDTLDGLPDAHDILPVTNGLVDLKSMRLIDGTPLFFSAYCLPFAYDPDAPPPTRWLRFLKQLWPGDSASIRELQKWFGYFVSGDKRQEKALILCGPTRSGKGTILAILQHLIGFENSATFTFKDLLGRFGLWPLLGKSLGIVTDARFSGDEGEVLTERLLSVTSRDRVQVDIKGGKPIMTQLPTRLAIATNETLNCRESSGALSNRFEILQLSVSFKGREDLELAAVLLTELPGILKWAIEGREMLEADGKFLTPKSAATATEALRVRSSPMIEFTEDYCEIRESDDRDERDLTTIQEFLWAYSWWCKLANRRPPDNGTFGKLLLALHPHITSVRPRRDEAEARRLTDQGERPNRYRGIELTEEGWDYCRKWHAELTAVKGARLPYLVSGHPN